MLVKWNHLLLLLSLFFVSVRCRTTLSIETTTAWPSNPIHWTVREQSYSPEDKYHYIEDCVKKCLTIQNGRNFPDRNNCIQLQCRLTSR